MTSKEVPAIRTVLGDVPASQLGPTHGHEHVLFSPSERFGSDLMRTEEHLAIEELLTYSSAGGSGLVDATVRELGRDPAALRRVSITSGVHIIAATGHTSEEWWWGDVNPGTRTVDDITDEMVVDLTRGMDDMGTRAGVIKIGTSFESITDAEAGVIRAAARAQQLTGAPITTHTTAGTHGIHQLSELDRAGADLEKVCVGHLDRVLAWDYHLELVRTGVFLGYDQISKEKYQPDSGRVDFIVRMIENGYGDRILLGTDLARRSSLSAWGGAPGLAYLLTSFVGLLNERGVASEHITQLLIDNPRRFLAWA